MKIFKPKGGSHCGDTFRELVDIWQSLGYCTVEESPNDFVWADEPGNILLYDLPRLDDRAIPPFRYGIFGNTVPECEVCFPWIFWARSPKLLMKARESRLLDYSEREIESVFLGKIENGIQNHNRKSQDWSSAGIELFHCPVDKPGPDHYNYSKEEYLEKLRHSKFGLCLAGYGPKCNREIELLGMGVVPIFAPEVDNTYHEPLIEGVHFIRVQSPEEVKKKINSIDQDEWNEMHKAGQDWYERNASPKGSFETTKRIIEDNISG